MYLKIIFENKKIDDITQNIQQEINNIQSNSENIENNTENYVQEDNIQTDTEEENTKENTTEEKFIGHLTIPKILLENAPVMETTSFETLSKAIGHFESTSIFEGNVGLASHNSGGKGDYFKNLKNVNIGDFIYYKTDYGMKKYIVTFKQIISEDDFSYLKENSNNRITLITCTKGQKDKRLCVQALEV